MSKRLSLKNVDAPLSPAELQSLDQLRHEFRMKDITMAQAVAALMIDFSHDIEEAVDIVSGWVAALEWKLTKADTDWRIRYVWAVIKHPEDIPLGPEKKQ